MYLDEDEFDLEVIQAKAEEILPVLGNVSMGDVVAFVKVYEQDLRGASGEEIKVKFEESDKAAIL